jgi:hypothetical protein
VEDQGAADQTEGEARRDESDKKLALEPGQSVTPHGIDRGLDPDEILKRGDGP